MSIPLSDDELIAELKKRFDYTKQALYDLKIVTRKLEEVNQKLEESEQLKSNFLSNIKNEINNPLTAILGLSQQLASGDVADPQVVKTVAALIQNESFNLDFQLRNIFMAAELESGEAIIQVALVDVDSMIERMVQNYTILAESRKIRFTVERHPDCEYPPGQPIHFKADPEKLQLVLSNLVSNAILFNKEGGQVVIRYGILGTMLNCDIKDTGIGIDHTQIHRLFERFRQLETGTTKHYRGHGLGLSVVKALLDLMNGAISVHCTPGEGCLFTVTMAEVETDMDADAFSVDGNEFFFDSDQVEAF